MNSLSTATLAPWIEQATALIGKSRYVGGNQFRHVMNTMTILIDYKYTDPVLLKASVIHDLVEDVPETDIDKLRNIDDDGNAVTELVLEVSRRNDETKKAYLKRIMETGTFNAKVLKIADRISNITDLHRTIFDNLKYNEYIKDTIDYVLPIAEEVNQNMAKELKDLIYERMLINKEKIH
jgi:hypothetical protein